VKDDRTFGQRLRETRVGAGMSQSDLEEISGIPKARLSRYENGHVAPSIQTLERLSKALKVSEASRLGDQRAMLEAFFAVRYDRGVRIPSNEQAALLGNAVADIAQAIGLEVERNEPEGEPPHGSEPPRGNEPTHGGEPTLSMATLSEWLAPGP
jgi:transcriptional regulator with XRE-family HTH domain